MSDEDVSIRVVEGILSGFPEGRPVGSGALAQALLTALWTRHELPYDWNPNYAWYRGGTGEFVLVRFGGFLVMTYPSPISSGSVSLLWGRGVRADLDDLAALDIASFRADAGTGAHVESLRHPAALTPIPNRDFDDYIYDLDEQLRLSGGRFRHRRRCLSALKRDYASVEAVPLDLASAETTAQVWRMYDAWAAGREESATIEAERRGLARALERGADAGLRCVGLDVEGSLRGFAVYDVFGDKSTGHFMKAEHDSDITAGTMHALFAAAHDAGATTINIGYDGGLANLRRAKDQLKPQRMARMVWLTP
ncbi:phosphatidylglycerol lysyltransferase domain-containing protein [Kribbella sp. NPDC051718]|uniref:phosphatidylglycerol lysyltransferase domain-containing protein n=1 Tax=Kribbella sp. NPDC051718 TaxID=3155168 RepID=UPI003429FDFD